MPCYSQTHSPEVRTVSNNSSQLPCCTSPAGDHHECCMRMLGIPILLYNSSRCPRNFSHGSTPPVGSTELLHVLQADILRPALNWYISTALRGLNVTLAQTCGDFQMGQPETPSPTVSSKAQSHQAHAWASKTNVTSSGFFPFSGVRQSM